MRAVNLLPPDARGAVRTTTTVASPAELAAGRTGAFAVLAVLALCVVALAAYVLTSNGVKERRAELDRVTTEAATASREAARLRPYADFAARAQERVQTVRDLASSRFDWEQALRDISRAVPADVTLTELAGSISSESGAGNELRSAIAAPAIDLVGCTRGGQRAVALLLSRLRNVEGVTRVSLAKSEKPDTPVARAAAGTGPTGCGPGRPPTFDAVVFFEHARVPASSEDITVGAAAPAGTPAPTPTPAP